MKCSLSVKVFALGFASALTMTSGLAVAQQAPPVDLGDLIVLYRDLNGLPYLTADAVEGPNTGLCQQPIAFNVPDPDDLCPDTCVVESVPPGADVVDVDQATCAVILGCEGCTREVEFGRISEARSSDEVFASQLDDVVVNLATSDCVVSLDPAGRMVTGTVVDDVITTSAIDSPLQNLAIYRQLIQTGSLGVPLPQGASVLDAAARGLGAASDKTGEVNVDLVVYLNSIMGLDDLATTTILDPKLCIQVREEVQGVVQLVMKCFLDYGAYGYDREANFLALPAPPYIDDPVTLQEDIPGWFEYLDVLDPTVPSFTIAYGPIVETVFPDTPFVPFEGDNIGAFAQASDDARAVIDFMHNWAVPVDFQTPVPCEALADITYDVSISPVSGLQVPTNIVSGTEGRELIVTVANAGPDPATGTVTVTAEIATGGVVPGSPWIFPFLELQAGQSESFTQTFSVTVEQATTIGWTAVAEAPFDVVPSNNIVTATSNVRTNSGGGGGGNGGRP